MAAQETYQSRQLDPPLERLPSGNAAEDQSAEEQAAYGVENTHQEGLSNASLDQAISLTVVYHNVKRQGVRPVHFDLSGLGATSTIEEIATRASQHLSGTSPSPSGETANSLPRLFYRGVELRLSQETLEERGISNGAVIAAVPASPHKHLSVAQLVPSSGSETGGNNVHIQGQCFRTTAERPLLARFGSTVVPTMPVSSEAVRCISPPHPPGPVSVEVSSDGGHTWTSDNVTYTYIGLRTVLDQPIRVPSVHCSAMSTVQELERAAFRHSRGF